MTNSFVANKLVGIQDEAMLIPWVQGAERFWGREIDLQLFEEGIEEGANYLLVAQRRMGKTSLALRDHKGIWTKTKELFANILAKLGSSVDTLKLSELSISLRAGLSAGNWASKGDELFEILASSDKPVLLLLDEGACADPPRNAQQFF